MATPSPSRAHKLLVLEDAVLTRLASVDRYVAELSALRPVRDAVAAAKPGTCAPCQARKRQQALTDALASAKSAVAALPPDRKLRLKEVLDAEQVRVVYRSGPKVVELTF